jgi:type II secretory pathway pseudopilin PulG
MNKCRQFSIIEVVIAIVVVAVGALSVIGLVSVGLNTGGKAMSEDRMSAVASSFGTYISNSIRGDWVNLVNTAEGSSVVPLKSGGTYTVYSGNDLVSDPDWEAVAGTMFSRHKAHHGLFKAAGSSRFNASVRVWQEAVNAAVIDGAGITSDFAVGDAHAVRLVVELSWPQEAPYSKRQRHYFHTTVTRE